MLASDYRIARWGIIAASATALIAVGPCESQESRKADAPTVVDDNPSRNLPTKSPRSESVEKHNTETPPRSDQTNLRREEFDIQRRMADAAEKALQISDSQANIARNQTYWISATFLISLVSTGAAVYAAKISRDSARNDLRPYISALPHWVHSFDENTIALAKYEIRNVGRTLAQRTRHTARLVLLPQNSHTDLDFPSLKPTEDNISTFFPNAMWEGTAAADRLFTRDELEKIRTGELRIGIFGAIWYSDVFGNDHETKFAVYMTASQEVLHKITTNSQENLKTTFFSIGPHNSAT